MVTEVTVYQAIDGSKHSTRVAAQAIEEEIFAVQNAMLCLGSKPDGTDFANGDGYITHSESDVLLAKKQLIDLSRKYLQSWMDRQTGNLIDYHPSWFGRLLDGSGSTALNRAWSRMDCMDEQFREWGQPYFAENPSKGTQREYGVKQ